MDVFFALFRKYCMMIHHFLHNVRICETMMYRHIGFLTFYDVHEYFLPGVGGTPVWFW